MKFDNVQGLLLAFGFLVPGFVWSAVYAALVPRKADSEQIRFMEFFALSCVNNAFWSWAIYLSYRKRLYESHEIESALLVLLVVFISPLGAALLTALFRAKGWVARFMDSLGFRTAIRKTTAWDYKFDGTGSVWVTVRLKSGDQVNGFFGQHSFAGDAGPTSDLYLEQVLFPGEKVGQSIEPLNHGVWIAADQIATIDFIGVN